MLIQALSHILLLGLLGSVKGSEPGRATVHVPGASIVGNVKDNVESFSGIPFAEPPIGPLRLKAPQRLKRELGDVDATGAAGACPQMVLSTESSNFLFQTIGSIANLPFVHNVTGQSEDCLTITVARPEGTTEVERLPVLFYIYGGGYQLGWSSMYDGSGLVKYGVEIGKPFVFVVANYRVNGFGFLPGKEILKDGSGNLGLLDQRMALEWVADNIGYFGGDPEKVSIWGESAGAWSVFNQMSLYDGDIIYKGKDLFRGAILASGGILPAQSIDSAKAQAVYDRVVTHAGCSEASDTLECLRSVDYTTFLNAVSAAPGMLSYTALGLDYIPRPDGKSLLNSAEVLAANGKYAPVPFIAGNQEDEGTLFALFQSNLTTTDGLINYLQQHYYSEATADELESFIDTYGQGIDQITDNSPYGTGLLNEIFPGFKRRASIIGDIFFTLTRRLLFTRVQEARSDLSTWGYISSYNRGTPILGTFHGADILQVFFGIKDNYAAKSIRAAFINFVDHLNPNDESQSAYPFWPKWTEDNMLMQFTSDKSFITKDDFRSDSFNWLQNNTQVLRL
ncbi:unnamed protein product [Clonostachys byssicola]|uniref:Carboxylic ester hydrolase n=1 Tax=Clonostachys byssicola TaxID=160290 RepID=A0A9N9UYW3_9HYPO|nr:unnamed protein product [Clonostachys byssicola]